jgi:hypothetical protein
MGAVVRKLLVMLLAVAFSVGTVLGSAAMATALCPGAPQHSPATSPHGHGAHDGHSAHIHHRHGAPEGTKGVDADKCCVMCFSIAAVDPALVPAIAQVPSPIRYTLDAQRLADQPSMLDPEIPKPMV